MCPLPYCLRLSATQSLLWASAAGNLSLSEAGAQSSMASKGAPCHATGEAQTSGLSSGRSAHDAFFSRPRRNLLTPAFAPWPISRISVDLIEYLAREEFDSLPEMRPHLNAQVTKAAALLDALPPPLSVVCSPSPPAC